MTASVGQSLPKLAVPKLKDTLAKFLYFCRILCDDADFEEAQREVERFLQGPDAPALQQILLERARTLPNWLTPWWNEYGYLRCRASLPIYSSVGISCGRIPQRGQSAQLRFAAKCIREFTKYIIKAKKQDLPVEMHGKQPLEMSHHHRFFASTRIPKPDCDELRTIEDAAQLEGHVVVARRGHTFILPVWDVHRKLLSEVQLIKELETVLKASDRVQPRPVNLCSSDNRDAWAKVYGRLKDRYPHSLRLYESALFVVALDEPVQPRPGQSADDAHLLSCFHGAASAGNAINRWHDKFHLTFDEDGYYGEVYEHTPADGAPLAAVNVQTFEEVIRQWNAGEVSRDPAGPYTTFTQKLEFRLTDEDKEAIENAAERLDAEIAKVDAKYFAFEDFGKNVPKQAKLSPDSFIQIALQLAFYRLHGRHGRAYESASLRTFRDGRTETIRLPNQESRTFVHTFVDLGQSADKAELCRLLCEACQAHKAYADMCAKGQGMDRHLFGLRIAALEAGRPAPPLFRTRAYHTATTFDLSTSQVPMRIRPRMIYAPLSRDGYAVLYNPAERRIDLGLSVFADSASSDLAAFQRALCRSLADLRDLLVQARRIQKANL